jgi:serine/threonine-protein kinase PpkA
MKTAPRRLAAGAAAALLLLASLVLAGGPAFAQEKPLLVEGKKSIYQRLITHPGAIPYAEPGGQEAGPPLIAFSVLYVYEMRFEEGVRWYRCGSDTSGRGLFWLNFDFVTLWNNNMTAVFAEKSGRPQPVLFFKSSGGILDIAKKPGIEASLAALTQQFAQYQATGGAPPDDFPLVAKEPGDEEGAIPNSNFYLMPILSFDDTVPRVKLLEVAAINPGTPDVVEQIEDKTLGICFVIDTTVSMDDYIAASRSIASGLFDLVQKGGHADDISLAFVAFRSSLEASPDIEYTTKLISDFTKASDRKAFEKALSEVRAATASTHDFNEDSMAGVSRALDLDWKQFTGGGTIILITDAGPLETSDPYNSVKDISETVYQRAKAAKVHIVPVHLKTPQGGNNHAYAEQQYRGMATAFGGDQSYIDLAVTNSSQGAQRYSKVMENFVRSLDAVFEGGSLPPPDPNASADADAATGARVGGFIGYSIYLNWLGKNKNTQQTPVVRSWIADKDMGLLEKDSSSLVSTVDICVLLTRNQVNALGETLTQLVQIAETVMGGGDRDFFTEIQNSSLVASTDPKQMTSISEMGFMEEFLEGLPYESDVLTLTKDDWNRMTATEQRTFLDKLKTKVANYRQFNENQEGWYKNSANEGEWLYRVPLRMLP